LSGLSVHQDGEKKRTQQLRPHTGTGESGKGRGKRSYGAEGSRKRVRRPVEELDGDKEDGGQKRVPQRCKLKSEEKRREKQQKEDTQVKRTDERVSNTRAKMKEKSQGTGGILINRTPKMGRKEAGDFVTSQRGLSGCL